MNYKYAVIVPTINKKNSILNWAVYVYDIKDISFFANNPAIANDITLRAYTDIAKNKTVLKPLTVRGFIYSGNEVRNKTPAFDGKNSVAIFENIADAVQWKIASTQVAYEEALDKALDNIDETLQKVKRKAAKITKEHDKIKEVNPEYFL